MYSVLGQTNGFLIAHAFGWHPFSFHSAGTLYGVSIRVWAYQVLGPHTRIDTPLMVKVFGIQQ